MTILALTGGVIVLLLMRQSLFVILGCAAIYAYLVMSGEALDGIVLDAWSALNKEILLAIPLYVLAGNIMAHGGIADRLVRFLQALTAPIRGGLAIAAVLSCAVFAAVTGSGTVTLVAIGSVMYPALLRAGYPKKYAIGALCASGTLGVIIPPSIPLILYGVMTRTNIAELFIAGVGPGLLLTIALVAYTLTVCRGIERSALDWREVLVSFREGIWALFMPVLILGGIYTGIFTPTESAAVAVVYALFAEVFIYREMNFAEMYDVTCGTGRLLGALFPVLMMAFSLNMFLTYQQVPAQMVSFLGDYISSPVAFIVGTNLFLLFIGCLMDIGSSLLILSPMLMPLAVEQGLTALHFGIIMVVNLEIGYLTPPLGLNLIVAISIFRESFLTVCRAVAPFVLLMLACLLLISFIPQISLFLVG